jgi:hypothetical protein
MPTNMTDFEILRKNQTEAVTIFVRDSLTNDLSDVYATSTFTLVDISDDTTKDSGSFGPTGSAKMVRIDEGIYRYNFNSQTYPNEYLLCVKCTMQNEIINNNMFIKSVSAKHFAYAAQLRLQVDKARKSIKDELINMDRTSGQPSITFLYGYDDKNLIFYLERGVQYLNAIPPYTTMSIDIFPFQQYGSMLIDAATISALESQGVLAIDTDYNYSLGGNQLVIDHFTKLSSHVSNLLNRFQKSAVSFKRLWTSPGLVLFSFMPGGVRAMRQLSALPSHFWSRLLSSVYQ